MVYLNFKLNLFLTLQYNPINLLFKKIDINNFILISILNVEMKNNDSL